MGVLGNVIWLFCGGWIVGLSWLLAGILWSITVIGLPWGVQCFKFAKLTSMPFYHEVRYGGGAGSLLLNLIWIIVSGIPLALEAAVIGLFLCVTIIGIPFGKQFFKIAKLSLMPFGSRII